MVSFLINVQNEIDMSMRNKVNVSAHNMCTYINFISYYEKHGSYVKHQKSWFSVNHILILIDGLYEGKCLMIKDIIH